MLDELETQGLITNYNKLPETLPDTVPNKVLIWDETLRDGEQTPAVSLTVDEKIEITKLMDEMGIAIIDVGFPAVSETEKKTVKKVASEGFKQASIAAPARALRSDIDVSIEAGADEIPIFVAFSNLLLNLDIRIAKP